MDIGETVITPLETMREAFMIEAEKVQDGGLKIVDMNWVLSRTETELVTLTVIRSAPHASPRPAPLGP